MQPRQRGQVHFCGHCGLTSGGRAVFEADMWRGQWYCGDACSHAAGDRTRCKGWNCGCTFYAKQHCAFRNLVAGLRIYEEAVLEVEGMQDDIEVRLDVAEVYWDIDMNDTIEETIDDQMDPDGQSRAAMRAKMEGLLAEAADQHAMVEAAAGVLERRSVHLNLERARMELEDLRSRQLLALLAP